MITTEPIQPGMIDEWPSITGTNKALKSWARLTRHIGPVERFIAAYHAMTPQAAQKALDIDAGEYAKIRQVLKLPAKMPQRIRNGSARVADAAAADAGRIAAEIVERLDYEELARRLAERMAATQEGAAS